MKRKMVLDMFNLVFIGLAAAAPSPRVIENYGKLPLSFEPNLGQTDARVKFISHGSGYTIFLSPTSATVALHRPKGSAVVRMDLLGANANTPMEPQEKLPGISNYIMGSTRANWPTSVPTYARTFSQNVYPGIALAYYGAQGQLEYDFILAPQADPSKIRLHFQGATPIVDASGDLVLPLGAKDQIRFHQPVLYQVLDGVRRPVRGRFTIAANHDVRFQVGAYDRGRELVIDPVLSYSSYLGGSSPSEIFAMALNAAGDLYLTGAAYATNYPTTPGVIEPTCPLGNTQLGALAGVPKCGEGESGTPSAFVSKISADGQKLLYSTYLGGGGNGSGLDLGTGIAVDANDNAWVVGQTSSNDFPITADAYLAFCNPGAQGFNFSTLQNFGEISACIGNGTHSLFLVHLNPTGTTMLYGTFLSGTGDEIAAQVALDAAGSIYIAGSAHTGGVGTPALVYSNNGQFNFPTTASAYQPIVIGGNSYSAHVTKLSADGKSLLYSTMFSGPNQNTYNYALAVNAGKIFIGGYTQDPHLPTTKGALSSTCVGGPTAAGPDTVCVNNSPNAYLAEFDPSQAGAASLVFSTYLNGSVSTQGNETSQITALAADAAGNVYAGGYDTYTVQEGFPTTTGVLQPACLVAHNSGECGTGFVAKFSPAGAMLWSTFYGSPSTTGGQGVAQIALDSSNNVYIAANTQGLGDYPLNNAFQPYSGGGAYITELSSDGSQVLFGSFYGGAANTYPTGLVVTPGNIYLAGYTNAYLPLVNALQSNNYGGGFPEGFFARILNPPPGPAAFVSAASSQPGPAAPGSIVSAYGVDLATGTFSASATPLPMTLNGTTVTLTDSAGVSASAPLFFASPGQVNFLVPTGAAIGSASIAISSPDGKISTGKLSVAAVAPSLFVLNSAGLAAGNAISVEADGSQVTGNTFQIVNGAVVPLPINLGAAQQVVLVLYGTGIAGRSSLATVSVTVGGLSLPAIYAGPQGDAGLDQVNAQLPVSLAGSGNTAISVVADGVASNTAFINIQ